ncbi:hypothetical protein P3T21_004512 [Paraburkholderia sp. GAS334]
MCRRSPCSSCFQSGRKGEKIGTGEAVPATKRADREEYPFNRETAATQAVHLFAKGHYF